MHTFPASREPKAIADYVVRRVTQENLSAHEVYSYLETYWGLTLEEHRAAQKLTTEWLVRRNIRILQAI